MTFTSIVTSGDFAGATLAQCPSIAVEGTPCTFQITFTPTAAGARTGTITFTDNATGSPQTVTLTGDGRGGSDQDYADFVDVWQPGGGNDERGADGDSVEQRESSR